MTEDNIIKFYDFLEGRIPLTDIENFIYSTKSLESQIDSDVYLDLVSLNYRDKYAEKTLRDFILKKVIARGQFETWRLKKILKSFIDDPSRTHKYLDQIYHLYCGTDQENGKRDYAYDFLGNLGLNYLYWIDEGYMRVNLGDNWEKAFNDSLKELDFYHGQLKPFATMILKAIDEREIEILDDGTYTITSELKAKLESDVIYRLKHPGL